MVNICKIRQVSISNTGLSFDLQLTSFQECVWPTVCRTGSLKTCSVVCHLLNKFIRQTFRTMWKLSGKFIFDISILSLLKLTKNNVYFYRCIRLLALLDPGADLKSMTLPCSCLHVIPKYT